MTKKFTQYFVWDSSSEDEDEHFWMLFDSLEDAVSSSGGENVNVEVYASELKLLGSYKMAPAKAVKVKKAKGSK